MKTLVTGGGGFIGSHVVDHLVNEGEEVVVYDVKPKFINTGAETVKADVLDLDKLVSCMKGVSTVYHFAADPEVMHSVENPLKGFEVNVRGTVNVLEAARRAGVERLGFASSGGTVYGESEVMPTPESEVFNPISPYGATKVCGEAYLSAYASSYDMTCVAFRYANVIGPRLTHGVIYDFYHKLEKNPNKLVVLGDGSQKKSYLHVLDAVRASQLALKKSKGYDYYNIGVDEWVTVDELARVVIDAMGLKDVGLEHTGGEKGWVGDVPKMLLDLTKIKSLGFEAEHSIEQSIRDTVKWLAEH